MNTYTINRIFFSLLLLITFSANSLKGQQNIQFTQYIFNSLSVNPAYAGYKEQWFAQLALRNQWTGIQDAPKTGQASIDGILDPVNKRMGLGLSITADQLGPQSSTSAYVNYSYRLRLNSDDTERLTFGIGAGATQYALDFNKLNPIDASDEYLYTGQSSNIMPDVRLGAYYYNPKWYIGASVMDLLSETTSKNKSGGKAVLKQSRHLYLISGMLFNLNPEVKLRPSILVKEDFKGPTSLDLNSMVIFNNKFWIGASYRTGVELWKKDYSGTQNVSSMNSVSAVAQMYINRDLRIGYSYDYTLNELSSSQSGSHEISLGLTFPQKSNRTISPRFF